ncbi:HD domain-containing protein [Klebsiella variicola]|uniref:HD domain-containing protein n=1 Tax=Klebsiella variicola TaxID=244366 RepID=UPI0035B5DE43
MRTFMRYINYLRYWGKTSKVTSTKIKPYHLLAYHCLDVAACGYYIIKNNIFNSRDILEECNIIDKDAERWMIWLLASWIGPYVSIHFLSLNPLLVRRRRYSRGERYPSALCGCHSL